MPPRRNNGRSVGRPSKPPEAMTWSRAMPVLIVAGIFDLLRGFFNFFWLFGPALGGVICTAGVTAKLGVDINSAVGAIAGTVCATAAGALGIAGVEVTAPFGAVMADAFGLIGFLSLGLWIIITNAKLFKTAASAPAWFVGAFALAEIPLLGAVPSFTIVIWRLYSTQIKLEKVTLKKWQKENAAAELQDRQQQLQIQQVAEIQRAEGEQQVANDNVYNQAANDDLYNQGEIPEEVRKAA